MEGQAQQKPAVSVLSVQIYAYPLAVIRRQLPAGLPGDLGFQRRKNVLAGGAEVLREQAHTELPALRRLRQAGNEALQVPAPGQLDQQFCDQIRSIVQEPVLLQRRVARGLNG